MKQDEIASIITNEFGANATYVEDLLRQFQQNPRSIDEAWSEYFSELLSDTDGGKPAEARSVEPHAAQAPQRAPIVETPAPAAPSVPAPEKIPLRGVALKIVENMEASLAVPTATSQRQVQLKVLDENRRWVNRHLAANARGKASYTHFIAWAMIKALEKFPQLNDAYEEADGAAYRIRRPDINLGVAVDVTKKDGSRSPIT